MKNTYTIPEASREAIQKLIARNQRKAERYGTPLSAEYGDTYAKMIPVYSSDGTVKEKLYEKLYEFFDLTIESEIIRKDGYTVAAQIEHLAGGNVVSTFDGDCKPEWSELKPHCDHCNGNHGQRVTFIVRHEDGTEKQVGSTCLKGYCGINPQAIGWANELVEVLIGQDEEHFDWIGKGVQPALHTIDALALAAMLQRTKGYTASSEYNSNKEMLIGLISDGAKAEQRDHDLALEIEKLLTGMTREEAFAANMNNVKSLLECGYCKKAHLGYIAYAPLAYERYMKKQAEKQQREASMDAERVASRYIGEIGQRMEIEVSDISLLTSWESEWGWTYLYKIVDTLGNVMIWYASRAIEGAKKIKATIKSHSERDGVKQTVITRCSVMA